MYIFALCRKYRELYATDDTFKLVYIRGHTNISIYALGIMAGLLTYYLQLGQKDFSAYRVHFFLSSLSIDIVPTFGYSLIVPGVN